MQQLCSLPFEYFSDNRLMMILFPTLIVCCFNNDDNLNILKQEMSTVMLTKFIEKMIISSQIDQLDVEKRRNISKDNNNNNNNFYLIKKYHFQINLFFCFSHRKMVSFDQISQTEMD